LAARKFKKYLGENMSLEIIVALIGLIGIVIGAIPTYLFMRRRESAEIDKLLAETDKARAEAEKIRSELQSGQINEVDTNISTQTDTFTDVSFIQIQKGGYKSALKDLTALIASSSQELLVLDYTPMAEKKNETKFFHDDVLNDERRRYYDETLNKIRFSENGIFRYRRIIQIPKNRRASELFVDDIIFRNHCENVIKLSKTRPEIASIKVGKVLYHGTFMIIDRRILILSADIIDPDDQNYYDYGYFRFDDPSMKIITPFLRYFDRADAKATLLKFENLN
jgi:hypothetical protein